MLNTPEERVKLLKAGLSGKEIEKIYVKQNNFKIIRTLNVKQIDDEYKEVADILISLGVGRNVAMALSYFQNTNSATSIDIEMSAKLQQPEISIAMKKLKERDWIDEHQDKKQDEGRSYKIYTLKVRLNDIISQLIEQQKKTVG